MDCAQMCGMTRTIEDRAEVAGRHDDVLPIEEDSSVIRAIGHHLDATDLLVHVDLCVRV